MQTFQEERMIFFIIIFLTLPRAIKFGLFLPQKRKNYRKFILHNSFFGLIELVEKMI